MSTQEHIQIPVWEQTRENSEMEIQASGAEGPVVLMSICWLEVTRGVKARRVPETAAEISDQREVGPQTADLGHERWILVDGTQGIVERRGLPLLYLSRRFAYAEV